ncbi:hypothetical protein N7478_008999 [Penicillium angulare]|uniref:uncharacterized protein n=1 Tax=Penicillium angulare TaxID=116970 RepID=UPI0025402292|nr:uncharacterized protein N7478_008999 [Penicillium angulare]KAJ5273874.1 hypothetical protein N7478_008999 [Penicillium angulare]
MRLHLIISRHGLPATRVLWTTTAAATGEYGSHRAAPTSAIASSRTPNIAFANGGYTIAQLLEDVNEVVPLETEPSVFDPEFSGQWGLEDYVVEVCGSECLHFMEVEGLLRDGDEVVIRALQLADLRARRLCGRHQIASDGKHLIDGVPFGLPFKQRNTSNRPAITIPPRKKRRTVFSGWDQDAGYAFEDRNAIEEEEGDGDWLPPTDNGFGKELSILPTEHDMSMGTVIRHPVDHSADEDSDDDMDVYEPEEEELESELKALKEDFEEPASQLLDIPNQVQRLSDSSVRRPTSAGNRPGSAGTLSRGSVVGASSLSSKRSRVDDSSPRTSKAVRFNKENESPLPPQHPPTIRESLDKLLPERFEAQRAQAEVDDRSSDASFSDSDSDSDSESDSSSESSDNSSSEEEESFAGQQVDSPDSGSSDDSSSESDSSSDESSPPQKTRSSLMAPPGQGSVRTKKSNNRFKLRRRLSKLKEIGVLPAEADFAALRSWEDKNGGWHYPEESSIISTSVSKAPEIKADKKAQEQREFEKRRQKLLDDLASGGVDVEGGSEKENAPPRLSTVSEPAVSEETKVETPETEKAHRRTLDVASSRRLLFGSLGIRTPRTKEDEEETRRKLAAQASKVNHKSKTPAEKLVVQEETEESHSDPNWQQKLIIRATECILPDIQLTSPPFPFVNRWDKDADAIIREQLGWGKKRKRKQRIQVYEGYDEYDGYEEDGYDGYQEDGYDGNEDTTYYEEEQFNYDEEAGNHDQEQAETDHVHPERRVAVHENDLPMLPADPSSLPDLLECEAKPGAIIAFRQLDMSKETNWQPRMSEYRVAEVHKVEDSTIHVLLAIRDRRVKQPPSDPENDGPRMYSGFEMPGFDDDDEDDDGYRDLTFAELSDTKLLKPAPWVVDDSDSNVKETGKSNAQEGSMSVN